MLYSYRPYLSGLTDDKVVSFYCKLIVIILELTMKNNSALILLERHFYHHVLSIKGGSYHERRSKCKRNDEC